ncbi:hypothetical protein LguiB_000972 [Lonicera macranthoides]
MECACGMESDAVVAEVRSAEVAVATEGGVEMREKVGIGSVIFGSRESKNISVPNFQQSIFLKAEGGDRFLPSTLCLFLYSSLCQIQMGGGRGLPLFSSTSHSLERKKKHTQPHYSVNLEDEIRIGVLDLIGGFVGSPVDSLAGI